MWGISFLGWPYHFFSFFGLFIQPAGATFHKDLIDDFNWNYLDHYVYGDSYFKELVEVSKESLVLFSVVILYLFSCQSLRYWRCRCLLLPVVMDMKADSLAPDEVIQHRINGFIQFLEALHKIRRPSSLAKSKVKLPLLPWKPLVSAHLGWCATLWVTYLPELTTSPGSANGCSRLA